MTGQLRQFSAENEFGVMTDASIYILISTRPLENELRKSEKGMCPSHRYGPEYHLTNPAIMVWQTKSNLSMPLNLLFAVPWIPLEPGVLSHTGFERCTVEKLNKPSTWVDSYSNKKTLDVPTNPRLNPIVFRD